MRTALFFLSPLLFGTVALPEVAIAQQDIASQQESIVLTYDDYMSLGYNAHQEGRYYEATQYFRYALYVNPNDEAAIVAYWNAYGELDNDSTTLEFDRLMNLGYDATDAGNYAVALEYFEQALAIRPGNSYASQAIRNVQTYMNYDGGNVDPILFNDLTEANPALEPILGESAYDRYMRLGYAALQREQFMTAADFFRSALYERPEDRFATIAYWNAIDGNRDGQAGLGSDTTESPYDRFMRLGYDATQRRDYGAALGFFRQALDLRPGDYYATEAIGNVTTYMSE